MLRDELKPLRDLISELTSASGRPDEFTMVKLAESVQAVYTVCNEIRIAWLRAFFSEAGDHSLKRYFNFHQEGIREISDSLFLFSQTNDMGGDDGDSLSLMNDSICALISHIQNHHTSFFDNQLNTPLYWRILNLQRCVASIPSLASQLASSSIDEVLQSCLITYFLEVQQFCSGGFCSFYAINYFEAFITKMAALFSTEVLTEDSLNHALSEFDFNRLDHFLYKRNRIKHHYLEITGLQNQIYYLQEKKIEALLSSRRSAPKCLPGFPALASMLESWLDEEIGRATVETQQSPAATPNIPFKKIGLNLSVAQIACFIRVLHDCKIITDSSLADIFRFVSAHFSSKMREQISEESLSKEYYIVSQSTARKVMEVLQAFLANLRGGFFPLLVAASVIFGVS